MDNVLRFKSKAVEIYDHTKIDVSDRVPEFTPDEAKIEKDIIRYRTKNGRKYETDTVAHGDMVTLSCESENKRLNRKNLSVVVGNGLFDAELEEKLIGVKSGEEKRLNVGGDEVVVSVLKIIRTQLAEVKESEMADIRRQCIDKQLDMFFDEGEDVDAASAFVCFQAAEKSRFELDDEEMTGIIARVEEKNDDPSMLELFKTIFVTSFKNALMGYALLEKEGALLTVDDYERVIDRDMEADPPLTREQAKAAYPLFEFMKTRYADSYIKMIDRYVSEEFKKALN